MLMEDILPIIIQMVHFYQYTDTSSMLSVYRKKVDSNFNGGYSSFYYLNQNYIHVIDTSSMLVAYERKG